MYNCKNFNFHHYVLKEEVTINTNISNVKVTTMYLKIQVFKNVYLYIYIKNKLPLYLQCKEDWINRIILIVQREVIFIVGHTIIFIITERINFNHVYIYICKGK